ncbi:putative ribosome-binding factor A, mitochondrial [Chiloscyllium plagiosum]|uniref:putative ribosome-binding factor A, mitochondrial n=1 Tax=Chiloscyllium plagiosum TaxID=36176 RepID=UPI001CB87354|nr:putative ribosome-binding factor A, mitochondrial [Chiloscyllium plagiosum]XP_043575045.1 putative ribosome-binding factor A, mitochondrial [Chiloscyllium plagiosum]
MAAVGVLSALRRYAVPGGWYKWQGLSLTGGQCRQVHSTGCLYAKKSLLKKFLSKSKKKFWYESPTLGSQLLFKPSSLENALKPQRKLQKEHSIRMRALNNMLYKAITELLDSNEVSSELYDYKVEISKVMLTVDFSACRAYWVASGSVEKDDSVQQLLQKCSARVRHLIISRQVMGNVPPVVFVKDQQQSAIAEVERLLEIADYGSEKETVDIEQVWNPEHFRHGPPDSSGKPVSQESTSASSDLPLSSLEVDHFGIDHDLLNRKILEYKKNISERSSETNNFILSAQHQEQLDHLKKLKRIKKKKSRSKIDDTPETYILEKYNMDSDTFSDEEEQLKEIDEEMKELETEEDNPKSALKFLKDM